MSGGAYWVGSYCYGFSLFSLLSASFCAFGLSMGLPPFTHCGVLLLTQLVLSWAHAQVMIGFFIAGLGSASSTSTASLSSKGAALIAYGLILAAALVGGMLGDSSNSNNNQQQPAGGSSGGSSSTQQLFEPFPLVLLALPPLAFTRALSLCLLYGGSGLPSTLSEDLQQALIWLTGSSTVLGVLGMVAHHAASSSHGSFAKSWAAALTHLVGRLLRRIRFLFLKLGMVCSPPSLSNDHDEPGGISDRSSSSRSNPNNDASSDNIEGNTIEEIEWGFSTLRGKRMGRQEEEEEEVDKEEDDGEEEVDVMVAAENEKVRSGAASCDPKTCVLLDDFTRVYYYPQSLTVASLRGCFLFDRLERGSGSSGDEDKKKNEKKKQKGENKEKVAVDGVNLAVEFGECFGLIG
jgi:hypothetical protein